MNQTENEGFESPKHEYSVEERSILIAKCQKDKPKTILKETHHSLEPDMVMGWKPKLPSCPLPLSYHNSYNQQLKQHIPTDDRFRIVYVGRRPVNSVQVNQQYSYFWRYRQRYSLNIALVQDAVKNVGSQAINFQPGVQSTVTRKQLAFDSAFQSGNLELAVKVKPSEYDLFLRSDTNTKGHTNWYYFRVNNQDFLGTVQFNICNMGKTRTLYNKGMKPYVYEKNQQSTEEANIYGNWKQENTFDVCFVERYCRYGFERKTYQLQFKYNFKKPNTQVYFAYGIPYTYSQMESFISEITQSHKDIVRCEKLCESLGGLNLPLLTISSPEFIQAKDEKENFDLNKQSRSLSIHENTENSDNRNKRAVLITGRIHPGESNSSHVLEGFIRELLKNDQNSIKLRNMYVFYIIPMLNPDGVVAGNFRTSYSGKDLNRQFNKLNKFVYPEIYHLDEFASGLKQKYKRRLEFYFDFHGHSSKKNLFCYGPEHLPSNMLFFKCRTFAKIIEEMNPIFSYRKSIFQVSEHKRSTGRAHMLWNLKIPMTFTFEISNGLYETKEQRNGLLSRETMLSSGKAIYKGLCRYVSLETRNFGCQITKAKVDSGIRSRKLSSEKNVRQRSSKIQRNLSRELEESRENSIQKNTIDLQSQMKQSVEFQKYIKEIKLESFENSQIEGGSDSEGSQDDLSTEELNKLHDFVKSRNGSLRETNGRHYSFKIKPVMNKTRERKNSVQEVQDVDEANKENIPLENNRQKARSINGIDTSRRLYQMSQKLVPIKKPPLPLPIVNTKVVLCQKKFEIEF